MTKEQLAKILQPMTNQQKLERELRHDIKDKIYPIVLSESRMNMVIDLANKYHVKLCKLENEGEENCND